MPLRRKSRPVRVGKVVIGGDAPIAVQTMTKAPLEDSEETLAQIKAAADAGCDLIRCAVPNLRSAAALAAVVKRSPLPVVADIHFDGRIALAAIKAGAAKIRINPGNMVDWEMLAAVAAAARDAEVVVRLGINSGSLPVDGETDLPVAMAEQALRYAARFEEMGCRSLVLSLKAADVWSTVEANRRVARQCDLPLHLGVTAAGLEEDALVRSALAIGALLADGIGDTIRLSFTASPQAEVIAARRLLRAAGFLRDEATLISCPTCGRCRVDLIKLAREVRSRLAEFPPGITVAVMGCEVNGPGEARAADIGIAASGGKITLFAAGQALGEVSFEKAVEALLQRAHLLSQSGKC